jgi:UDP-N-acetylglucosamine acyltransferase
MPETAIHPTAIIHPKAALGQGVQVGPYAIVEASAVLGDGCVIHAHAQILKNTALGSECVVGHASILGGDPQAKGFDPQTPSRLVLGDRNIIREHVTIHRSLYAGGETRLGNGNFLMATSHAGHDVIMGDDCILANGVMLAGHVTVGSRCFLGGGSGFHQFIRIGEGAIVQGNSSISMDVPPFCMLAGSNTVYGINNIGLKRQGHDSAARLDLKRAFDLIFRGGKNISQAVQEARESQWGDLAERFIQFVEARGKKGIATPAKTGSSLPIA